MIKAVIFDMDGLMFDTESLWVSEGSKLAKRLGYDFPVDLFYKTVGMKNDDASKVFNQYLGYQFPFMSFRKMYHQQINQKLCYEKIKEKLGLRELLVYLKNNQYKIAIASSNMKERINLYLKSANINPKIFNVIVSGDDVKKGKPSPEIFNKTCYYLNERPENTLVLEDSVYGIIAANKANCHSIVVPDMIEVPMEIEKMADFKVNSLMDVISILNEKNK